MEILGAVRGKLVITYDYRVEHIVVTVNGTKLTKIKNKSWRRANYRYGERGNNLYAEYLIPALPTVIEAHGLYAEGRRPVTAQPVWMTDDTVCSAAKWNDQYMPMKLRHGITAGPEKARPMTLRGQRGRASDMLLPAAPAAAQLWAPPARAALPSGDDDEPSP